MQSKVGLLLVTAKFFWNKKIHSCQSLSQLITSDAENIVNRLSEHMKIINSGIVTSVAEAVRLYRKLKNSKIGLLPYRCEVMTDTYVDEFSLMRQIGPVVKYISVAELLSASNDIKESDIITNLNDLKKSYQVCNV